MVASQKRVKHVFPNSTRTTLLLSVVGKAKQALECGKQSARTTQKKRIDTDNVPPVIHTYIPTYIYISYIYQYHMPHLHGSKGRLVGLPVVSSRHPYKVDGFRVPLLPFRKDSFGFPRVLVSIVPVACRGGGGEARTHRGTAVQQYQYQYSSIQIKLHTGAW